jgi:hypothetical protein
VAGRCLATARSGKRCAALAVDGQHCPWHSAAPEWIARRQGWAAEGGRRRSNRQRANRELVDAALSPAELQGLIAITLRAVLAEKKSPAIGSAIAALVRAAVAVREATQTEERLVALEEAIGLEQRRRA